MAEIRNPNSSSQGPGSGGDMRSMLAFSVLALVALLAFQYFKPASTPAPQQSQTAQIAQTAQSGIQPATTNAAGSRAATPPGSPADAASAAAVVAASETTTTVENQLYRITFTNRGAQVKSWILKHYNDSQGHPLDMVNQRAAASFGFPLSLYTYDPSLTSELNSALYQGSATGTVAAPAGIIFKYAKGPLVVTKTFTFNETYVIDTQVTVTRNGSPVRALLAWPSGLGDQEEVSQFTAGKFAWSIDGKRDSEAATKVSGNATLEQPYDYAAAIDLYFAVAFLPATPARSTLVTLHNQMDAPKDIAAPNSEKFKSSVLGLAMGDTSGATHTRLFAGPMQFDVLANIHSTAADGKATGEDLKPLIQFGYLKVIAEPLFLLLRYVHGFVHNWGWAIVIVTLVFNLLMLPTRLMMMRSSLKMQRVQPKLEAIKKRYAHLKATDPKRAEMNAETMALYKTEGINMYGGCLPLLIQMPLFFAYYRVLANVIELRQAQWGWLHNLATPDAPLHILPIIIIISMFLVQFITPSPGMDPAQRRMMAFMMPAIFGFSMWNFASGLALYWATGNLLNLGLQLAINNSSMGQELKALAAKRAAKSGNKTIAGRPLQNKTIQGRR